MTADNQEYQQINSRINKKLYVRIQKYLVNNKMSLVDFMTTSFEEKLSRTIKEDETLTTMVDQIKNMDPMALHGALADLVYTAQVIFKKIVEQEYTLKEIKEQLSDYEEEEETNELSQYEKDQIIIEEYYKSVEQRYGK